VDTEQHRHAVDEQVDVVDKCGALQTDFQVRYTRTVSLLLHVHLTVIQVQTRQQLRSLDFKQTRAYRRRSPTWRAGTTVPALPRGSREEGPIFQQQIYGRKCCSHSCGPGTTLDQVGNVHGHFIDLRGVVLLNVTQNTNVVVLHEVDRHTLPAESS